MLQLKDYQKTAIKQLKEKLLEMLDLSGTRQKIVFKAPTGSGKTVMSSALLDELIMELQSTMNEVAFIWIAPNKLHVQSYISMRNFFTETRTLNPVMFADVDCSSGLQPGDVLFLNWESINKDNAVMIRDNEQNRHLRALVKNTKQNGLPIVVIIDEEHMYTGSNAKKSEVVLQMIQAKIELRISATPITGGCPLIDVPREKVIAEEMIKKGIQLNPDLKGSNDATHSMDEQLIELALQKRNALARAYREHDINPLLLIQLPNDKKDTLDTEEKEYVEKIKTYLDVNKGINVENNRLAVWLSGIRENVAGIENKDSMTDVLLFKQAIALGWDCPRAAVLLIFRDLKSPTFSTQTVGRILRMPEQQHYTNEALNYGYVYTNLATDMIQVVKDDMSYITTIYAKQRDNIDNIKLPSVYQNRRKEPHVLLTRFKDIFFETVSNTWKLPQMELFGGDDGWGNLKPLTNEDTSSDEYNFSENRRKANKHGIKLDVQRIRIRLPKDVVITGEEQVVYANERVSFCRTQDELNATFNQFCRKNVGEYEPSQSAEMIRNTLYDFFEQYLGMGENEATKVVLYNTNQPKFAALIAKAEEKYAKVYEERSKERDTSKYVPFEWMLPETRMYNSDTHHSCEKEVFYHAMKPFFEENNVSKPEYKFSRWIDQQNEVVQWWYKNADSGNMHFAVPYNDHAGVPRCFYVDYIIRLKNGKILLLDTKSKGSDEDAPQKHNALLQYVKEQNKLGRNMMGSIVIQDEVSENWMFSPLNIDQTDSIAGWSVLDLEKMNKELKSV